MAIRQAHLLDRAYKLPFDEEESIADDKASGRCSAACGDRAHDGAEADLGEGADLMREAISMHSEELTTAPKPGSLSAMLHRERHRERHGRCDPSKDDTHLMREVIRMQS